MTDATRLEWPQPWPLRRGIRIGGLAFFLVFVLTAVALAATPRIEPSVRVTGVLVLPLAVSMAALALGQVRLRRRSLRALRVVAVEPAGGTLIPERRLHDLCLVVPAVSLLLAGLAGIALGATDETQRRLLPGALAFSVISAWATVELYRKLRRPAHLLLTPTCLELRQAGSVRTVPWGQLMDVRPSAVRRPAVLLSTIAGRGGGSDERPSRWNPFRPDWGGSSIKIEPERYAIDPVVLLATLEFYLAHPTLRGELADGQVLERIQRGALTREDTA